MAFRIYPRGNVYWVHVYFPGSGKRGLRKSTGCSDPRAADTVARKLERAAADPGGATAHETSFGEALSRFLAMKVAAKKAAGTLHMYSVKAGQLQRVFGKDTPLALVEARAIDGYVTTRREEGASDNTIDKELTTLRGTLKLARHRREYPHDVASVMPLQWSSGYKPRKTYLDEAAAEALLGALPAKRAAHVAFILATSARDSEVSRAERRDIDLARGFVKLRGTKTEGSDRTVPVLPFTRSLLERALADATGHRKLFEPWTNQRRDLEQVCTKLRIGRHVVGSGEANPDRYLITANDLRRSLATWLVHRGVDTYLVGRILGHKSSRMVEKVYGVMTPEALGTLVNGRPPRCEPDTRRGHRADVRADRVVVDGRSIRLPTPARSACAPGVRVHGRRHVPAGPPARRLDRQPPRPGARQSGVGDEILPRDCAADPCRGSCRFLTMT